MVKMPLDLFKLSKEMRDALIEEQFDVRLSCRNLLG